MNITERIFNFIKKAGEVASEITITYQEERKILRSSYYGSINRLEKQGLIEKRKKQKRLYYAVTEQGRKYRFPKKIEHERRTDGLSTVIIFDIPETMSRQRTVYRRFLQHNNYALLQKSVMISPKKFSKDIVELMEELKVRPYITVLSSKVYYF